MVFSVNTSAFAGREGKYVTTRQLKARLEKNWNATSHCEFSQWKAVKLTLFAGRGVLHLAVLIETMRREGFELSVSKPRVIVKEINGFYTSPLKLLRSKCQPTRLVL